MKNFLLFILLSLINIGITLGQATDFTTDDCNGVTHNLFDSLDAGNVIVIAWVMPCSPCATYSMPAYSAVQSFSSSHPGRVHFYMADDYANTSCSSLSSWGNNYNMPNSTFFFNISYKYEWLWSGWNAESCSVRWNKPYNLL